MNDLAVEAVSTYVRSNCLEVERELEDTLAKLREYTRKDPSFEKAIEDFAKGESELEDPAEGVASETELATAKVEIRGILN
jgi:hypothetical protein